MWKLVGPLVSIHRLVLFFPDVHRLPDPPVHPVAFSVDHLGTVPVYDVVQRDDVVCDYRLVLLCRWWTVVPTKQLPKSQQ